MKSDIEKINTMCCQLKLEIAGIVCNGEEPYATNAIDLVDAIQAELSAKEGEVKPEKTCAYHIGDVNDMIKPEPQIEWIGAGMDTKDNLYHRRYRCLKCNSWFLGEVSDEREGDRPTPKQLKEAVKFHTCKPEPQIPESEIKEKFPDSYEYVHSAALKESKSFGQKTIEYGAMLQEYWSRFGQDAIKYHIDLLMCRLLRSQDSFQSIIDAQQKEIEGLQHYSGLQADNCSNKIIENLLLRQEIVRLREALKSIRLFEVIGCGGIGVVRGEPHCHEMRRLAKQALEK